MRLSLTVTVVTVITRRRARFRSEATFYGVSREMRPRDWAGALPPLARKSGARQSSNGGECNATQHILPRRRGPSCCRLRMQRARPPFRDSLSHLRRRERPAGRSFMSRMLMRAQAADANDRIALCVAAQQPPYALSHVPHEALARCRDRELGSNSLSVMSFTPACTRDSTDAGRHDIVVPRHRRRHATAASSDFFCVSFGRRANGRVCRQYVI